MIPHPTIPRTEATRAHALYRGIARTRQINPCPSGGFTLMEMILALGISGVVLASIGGVFFTAMRLRDRTSAAIEESAPICEALDTMRRDLKNVLPPGGVLAGEFIVGAVESTRAESPGMQFSTTTGVIQPGVPWGDVQEIVYELRAPTRRDERGGRDLVRTVSRNLLTTTALDAREEILLANVELLEFTCYDGSVWRDDWDTTLNDTNAPSALRVRLQMAPHREFHTGKWEPYEMIVPLVTRPSAPETTTEEGS